MHGVGSFLEGGIKLYPNQPTSESGRRSLLQNADQDPEAPVWEGRTLLKYLCSFEGVPRDEQEHENVRQRNAKSSQSHD